MSKPELVRKQPLNSIQRIDLQILGALESGKLTTLLEVEAAITAEMFRKKLWRHFIRLEEAGEVIHEGSYYRISHVGRLYLSALLRKLQRTETKLDG